MNFTLTHGRTKYNLHNEEFKVLDRMPFDVIIGLPCIRRHDLTRVFRVHFVDNPEPVAGLKGTVRAVTTNTSSNPTAGDSWLFAMGSKTVHKSILLDTEYDDDAIEQFTHEATWDNPPLNLEADVSSARNCTLFVTKTEIYSPKQWAQHQHHCHRSRWRWIRHNGSGL